MSSTEGPQDSANTGRRGGGRGRGGGSAGGRGGISKGPGENASNARDGGDGGGGRGRGRGRGRGGGRGRGNRDRAQSQGQGSAQPQPTQQPVTTGVVGGRLVKDAQTTEAEEVDDSDLCFICASNIDHHSVAPCNHRTCHVCALRMRALYKTKACAHCRTEVPTVIFTDDAEKRFEDYNTDGFFRNDGNMGICYEKQDIFEDTVVLLRYNCPDADCDEACLGWPDLHRHVRTKHQKVMCDLCTRNKKVFTHEHELFTPQELRQHERTDTNRTSEQTGFKGHPDCKFCKQRFYGDDELFVHLRDRHERCHLCDRNNPGKPRYFLDYNDLERHFNSDHYPCMDAECQEKKFVVFDSAMDLKAHQVSEHPNGLTKDARRVDISGFNYRSEYQQDRPQRGGRREARGGRGGRGRDPNAEGPPPTTSAHMTRAEIAHQRNREIQSAQSVTSRSFGGSLSQPPPPSQVAPRPSQEARSAPTQQPQQQPDNGAANPASMASEQLTPQEQARRLRHAAVTERASNLLQNDQTKLAEFRQRISAFRNGTISAPNLIETFFALFDTTSNELGKLIKEIAEIFEIPGKRDALLKAWSDWKAINEDYPSLPAPAGESSSSAAGLLGARVGTSRVLKLKSSTAQSSRGAVGHQANWAANKRPPVPGNTPLFPALPSKGKGSAAPAPTPSWLAAPRTSQPSSSVGSSARVSPAPSRSQSSANLTRGTDAFPSLPAARKPTSTVFSPGYSGAGVIRQSNSSTPVNAWGGSGDSGPSTPSGETPNQRQAKGRKGKQVMYQWG
jgi:hypothetical protein